MSGTAVRAVQWAVHPIWLCFWFRRFGLGVSASNNLTTSGGNATTVVLCSASGKSGVWGAYNYLPSGAFANATGGNTSWAVSCSGGNKNSPATLQFNRNLNDGVPGDAVLPAVGMAPIVWFVGTSAQMPPASGVAAAGVTPIDVQALSVCNSLKLSGIASLSWVLRAKDISFTLTATGPLGWSVPLRIVRGCTRAMWLCANLVHGANVSGMCIVCVFV